MSERDSATAERNSATAERNPATAERNSATTERNSLTDGIERRGVLAAVATGLGGVGLARSSFARQIDAMDASQYVVEQNGRCIPIAPISGDETVERFYDYRTPDTSPSGSAYSSYGTIDLQRPETSICFLYDGPEGLSLVVVHDELEDGTNGGAVTFQFDGLAGGSWVVGDDDYDGSTNYDTWTETSDGWKVDWTWASGRSDGGVFRPLGDEFAVTIDPAFNEDAALYGEYYEGSITDWQVLSGDRSDPERVSLALDQPLTIRAGGCGGSQTTTTTSRETTTEEETTTKEETTTDEEESTDDQQSAGPISVEVEVEPGKVNPRSHGRLPVVVYSTGEFDATTLESRSVEFGPGNASPVKRIRTDADGDGRRDLKLHFWMDEIDVDWDTDELELTGRTSNGREVVGVANIELVPAGGDDEDENENETENKDEDKDGRDENDSGEDEREQKEREGNGDEQGKENEAERERRADDGEEGEEREDDEHDEDEEDEEDDERERDDEEDEKDDYDDDNNENDERGRGRGRDNGRGRGRGNGDGRGRDRGSSNDRGKGRGNGRGNDRDEDD